MPYPFFQISNCYCQKSYNGFRVFLGSSTTSQIFLIYTFLTKKQRPFYFFFFEICTNMHFVSLFFLNERNITTNLNSSSINMQFLNQGPLNILFLFFSLFLFFFDFLFTLILTRLLSKKLWNNYHLLMQIFKTLFKMLYSTKY